MTVRQIPWILALAGVILPLAAGGFSTWPLAAVWLAILAALRAFARLPADRFERIALAVATLPMLFLAAFEGGWYLLPAAVAWLLVEIAGRPPTPRVA